MGGKDKPDAKNEVVERVTKGLKRLEEDLAKDESEIDDNKTDDKKG